MKDDIKVFSKDFYVTTNLALAAALHSLAFPFVKTMIVREEPIQLEFKFESISANGYAAGQIVDLYWQQKLIVEPQSYYDSVRFLKDEIHDQRLNSSKKSNESKSK